MSVPTLTHRAYRPGSPDPLGARLVEHGVNFAVAAPDAGSVELLLFDSAHTADPFQTITMVHSDGVWHAYVPEVGAGLHYGYRLDSGPGAGKLLADPYARAHALERWDRLRAIGSGDNTAWGPRSVVVDTAAYDWGEDRRPATSWTDSVLYEVHVRGFSRGDGAAVRHPGTFSALTEKIPYLLGLGVTAVELLPVFEFDATEVLRLSPTGRPLRNYWGYDPIGFFALHAGYGSAADATARLDEFRDMVKEFHRAGLEVILDVVFNHTGEGNADGPAISLRGFAERAYYHVEGEDGRVYRDFTDCGNSVNANHPLTTRLIVDSLEYWASEHHVDGFRLDMAAELVRGPDGRPLAEPPVLAAIADSAVLAPLKLIVEPWDAAGGDYLGSFPGPWTAQWNGRFRDDSRVLVRGDGGLHATLAARLCGSPDVFGAAGSPGQSVNYVTCHDGFSLADLVSYVRPRNEANGEGGHDGVRENHSWNNGAEGPTDAPDVDARRLRCSKALIALTLLSRGVPMLLAGDESRNTQYGNNNPYCHDDQTTWLDWTEAQKHGELRAFVAGLTALRRRHAVLRSPDYPEPGTVRWFGPDGGEPDWDAPGPAVLACVLTGVGTDPDLLLIVNLAPVVIEFALPAGPGGPWKVLADSAAPPGFDIIPPGAEGAVGELRFRAGAHSVAVLACDRSFRPALGSVQNR
jgi:isoamylase